MSSAIPCRAAARRSSGAKVSVVQVPTRPGAQPVAQPGPGLHRAAGEEPAAPAQVRKLVLASTIPTSAAAAAAGRPASRLARASFSASSPAGRSLDRGGGLEGLGGGGVAPRRQMLLAERLERGRVGRGDVEVHVPVFRAASPLRVRRRARLPGAGSAGRPPPAAGFGLRFGGSMMRESGAVTMAPAGTLVITTAFGPMRTPSPTLMAPKTTALTPTSTRLPSFGAGTCPTQTPGVAAALADRDPLPDHAVVADHRVVVDDDAVLVADDEPPADPGR